jgi:hypothetical protein
VETREQASRMRDAVEDFRLSDTFTGYPSSSSEPVYDGTLQRYIRRPIPGDEQNGFCHVCNSINFAEIAAFDMMDRNTPFESTDRGIGFTCVAVFHLSMDMLAVESGCPLCAMFRAYLNSVAEKEGNIVAIRLIRRLSSGRFPIDLGMAIEYDDWDEPDFPDAIMSFWPDMRSGPAVMCGSFRVDLQWLQHTLQVCESQHGHGRNAMIGGVEDMHLIDCYNLNNLRVVSAASLPPAVQYLTLSYVWGRDDPNGTDDRDPLYIYGNRSPVATTIADAIRLTHVLGKRYLWNDYYCISQEHREHKSHQMKLMGKIFGQSWATIVALGPNNRTHISGLFVDRKAPPFTSVPAGGLLTIKMKSQVSHGIGNSTWNTRGWTFQEQALSQRMIYFCDNEVIFQCGLLLESENNILGECILSSEHTSTQKEWDYVKNNYPKAVREYSNRNLTSASDNLDAFRGYLAETSQRTYWAVPIIRPFGRMNEATYGKVASMNFENDVESGLCAGLLWFHNISNMAEDQVLTTQLKLSAEGDGNQDFPSWSWISCRWPVSCLTLFDYLVEDDAPPHGRSFHGTKTVDLVKRCSICIDFPGLGILPVNTVFAEFDFDPAASRFRTKDRFRIPGTEYTEIRDLCMLGKPVSYTLMNTHEPLIQHLGVPQVPLPSHFYLCRLGSVIEGDETRFFQRACFYPDHGRMGKSRNSAAFSNTGKALFLATLTQTHQNDRQEEYFCFLALNKITRSDRYARVGIILAVPSEPRAGNIDYSGIKGKANTGNNDWRTSDDEYVIKAREFAGRHRNGSWWNMLTEIEGRREEMVRLG